MSNFFEDSDNVFLNHSSLPTIYHPLHPLLSRFSTYLGPFTYLSIIGDHKRDYRLELPPMWEIHPVFYVSLLEPHHVPKGDVISWEIVDVDAEGEKDHKVGAILAD